MILTVRAVCDHALRSSAGVTEQASAPAARCRNRRWGSFIADLPLAEPLLDHLVGAAEQRQRNGEAEGLGGPEIDGHLDFRDLLHR